jgi:hypothetical protein
VESAAGEGALILNRLAYFMDVLPGLIAISGAGLEKFAPGQRIARGAEVAEAGTSGGEGDESDVPVVIDCVILDPINEVEGEGVGVVRIEDLAEALAGGLPIGGFSCDDSVEVEDQEPPFGEKGAQRRSQSDGGEIGME